jgi:hypothetical protein
MLATIDKGGRAVLEGDSSPVPETPTRRQRRRALRYMLNNAYGSVAGLEGIDDLAVRRYPIPSIAGGATGAGGVAFLSNLPPDQFQINPALFETATEMQVIPQASQPFNGFGSGTSIRLQNVGIVAMIRLYFSGTLTVAGSGTVTSLPGWPYNMIQRLAFNAQGTNALLAATGPAYRARRTRLFRNPAETLLSSTGIPTGTIANGSYAITFMVDIPVSHDMFSGVGWVLAQNPSTTLSIDIAWAAQANSLTVGTGSTVTWTNATVYSTMVTFAVGQAQSGNQTVTIIPDLTTFHGFLENQYPFTASGIVQQPLIRTAGQLVNYAFNLRNGPTAEIVPDSLTEVDFRYGGNRQPRQYNPPQMLIEKNQADYNGRVQTNGLTWTYLDFEADNAVRDVFLPENLVELQAQFIIPTSVTVNSGAYVDYLEETLYPAV